MGKNKPQYYAVSKGSIMSNGLSFGLFMKWLFKGVKKSAPYWFRGDHYITPWTPVKSNSKTKTSSIVVFKFSRL
jgi:hypothetical protein